MASATNSPGTDSTLSERMSDRLPWMLALSPDCRDECARQILSAARASVATNDAHLAIAELTAWRETATALAAGLGHDVVEWLDDAELVERP